MSYQTPNVQDNSMWPCSSGQQPGTSVWPSQPYQQYWPYQPNQANWPGTLPTMPNWPVNPPNQTSWPGIPSAVPNQPTPLMPQSQPFQPNQPFQPYTPMPPSQPYTPMPPSQPFQPYTPMPPSQPTSPMQPSQPTTPVPPSQPFQPNQLVTPTPSSKPNTPLLPHQPNQPTQPPGWPSQLPSPTSPAWHGNPGQSGWPGQVPTGGQQQPWPPVPSTGPVSVPFNMNFPRGFYDKLMLTIRGQVKPNAKMFTVNFLRGKDIAMHINPRFNELGKQVLVRNHQLGDQWGKEERTLLAPFPFVAGQHFEMKILCTVNEFKVVVNNTPLFEFKHRIKEVNQIDRINILHDVSLTSVNVDTLS